MTKATDMTVEEFSQYLAEQRHKLHHFYLDPSKKTYHNLAGATRLAMQRNKGGRPKLNLVPSKYI